MGGLRRLHQGLILRLDQLRLDPRVKLPLAVASPRPLRSGELIRRIPIQRRLAAPVGGVTVLALATALALLVPPPARQPSRAPEAGLVAPPATPRQPQP